MEFNLVMVGKRIKEARMKKDFSQAELAELIDVSVVYISYVENAKRQVRLEMLDRIANALEVTAVELLTGNQAYDHAQYKTDIDKLLSDCTNHEKCIIFETIRSLKNTLRENNYILLKI